MTTTNHTPEPWSVDSDTLDGAMTLVFDANGDLVANTAPDSPRDRESCQAECEANARLIAESPALLAACEDLLPMALAHLRSLTESMPAEDDDTDDRLPHPDKWELSRRWYAARAAIAKAKGL